MEFIGLWTQSVQISIEQVLMTWKPGGTRANSSQNHKKSIDKTINYINQRNHDYKNDNFKRFKFINFKTIKI